MTQQELTAEVVMLRERLNRSEADREILRGKVELYEGRLAQLREQLRAILESVEP